MPKTLYLHQKVIDLSSSLCYYEVTYDKGKPIERLGRKAKGPNSIWTWQPVAEELAFFDSSTL